MTEPASDNMLKEIICKLFLCLSWDARQRAKTMMTDAEVVCLRAMLSDDPDDEPNW